MTRLLLRVHTWIHDAQASRRVRIALTVVLVLAVGAGTVLVGRVALNLNAQRQGILAAIAKCSIKDSDPAALQLVEKRTVTVGGRDYGGARAIPNPAELFNDQGNVDEGTKQDLAWRLVINQVPPSIPFVLVQSPTATFLGAALLLVALIAIVWIGLGGHLLEWGLLVAATGALCWALDWMTAVRALLGIGLAALLFAVLWKVAQAALFWRAAPVAVARTTVMEGVRSLAAVGFAAPVAILLPLLALSRDPEQGLYQAIPGFLDWGHTVVYSSAALLVIIFGCATTAFEIRDRQVWTVLTKPVSRLGWMVGKWLGTLTLGCVVLFCGGLVLNGGAQYLAAQPPIDERDASEVRNTVLVGRTGTGPDLLGLSRDRLLEIVDQAIEADAALKSDISNGQRKAEDVRREIAVAKQKEFMDQQRSIPPGQFRDYTFRGLGAAVSSGKPLSLRYKLHGGADDSHQSYPVLVQFQKGEDTPEWVPRFWVPGEAYSINVEPRFVTADGTLKVRLFNAGFDEKAQQPFPGQLTMYFDHDGIEVMYVQASFGDNLARAILVDVAKIGFLAALAVVSSTMLSFPVAVLLSFGIFSMATLTPFLAQSLEYYDPDRSSGWIIFAFQWAVKVVARSIEFALSGFAQRAPSDSLAQGRVISWRDLAETLLSIGVLWTGGTLLAGWLAARRKEIAVYSGQS